MTGPTYPPPPGQPQWQPQRQPPPPPGHGRGYGPPPQQWTAPPQWQPPPPPPPVEPPLNIAAVIAAVSGVIGLLVLPIVFGPAALIAGFVGDYQARRGGRRLLWVAVLGIVLGTVCTLVAAVTLNRAFP